jgi:hypothetical protein
LDDTIPSFAKEIRSLEDRQSSRKGSQSKKAELEVKIEVDMPLDIIKDKERLKAVENGLVQSIYDGLYRRGVSFRVDKIHFKIK